MRPAPTPLPPTNASSGPPPFPNNFRGSVTIDGEPAANDIEIYAEIVSGEVVYGTLSVLVADGQYTLLKVAPPSILYEGATINFYAWMDGVGVQAAETVPFDANVSLLDPFFMDQDLTFTTSGS